jgi:hypothetical protein
MPFRSFQPDQAVTRAAHGTARQLTVIEAGTGKQLTDLALCGYYAQREGLDFAHAHASRASEFTDLLDTFCDRLAEPAARALRSADAMPDPGDENDPYQGAGIVLAVCGIDKLTARPLADLLRFIKEATTHHDLPVWTVATVTDFARFSARAYGVYPDASMMWESYTPIALPDLAA